MASVIYLVYESPHSSSVLPSIVKIGRATLRRWFTRTCSPQQTQPDDHPSAGGLLHHLLTLTSPKQGGHSLLPSPTVTNSFHFQKWGTLCCPDFPLVPEWHQRQTVTVLSVAKLIYLFGKEKLKATKSIDN